MTWNTSRDATPRLQREAVAEGVGDWPLIMLGRVLFRSAATDGAERCRRPRGRDGWLPSCHGALRALALASLVSACGNEGRVNRSIAATVEKGPGTRLVLAEHAGFPWDKVCILGPYTPDDKVDSLTGIQGAAGQAYDIRSNDGINVLMFVREGRIASSVAHGRNQGDFGPEVVGQCYSREQANFSIRIPPPNSWGNIGPE